MKFSLFCLDIRKLVFPFVFQHCDIIQLECFGSIVSFVNNILTYSLGYDINMCRTDKQFIWCVILSI